MLNCSINRSSVTNTANNANGVGLFLGDFGGSHFTASNCVAANSTVTVTKPIDTEDGSALLFGTCDNGGAINSITFDNIASFNNTMIAPTASHMGIIATFANAKNAPVVATNIYAVNNQIKASKEATGAPLTSLFMVVYESYVKSVSATNTVTDYPVGMAFGQVKGVDKTLANTNFSSNLTVEKALAFMNANTSDEATYFDWAVTETTLGTTEEPSPLVASFQLLHDTLHFTADASGKVTFTEEEIELLSSYDYLLNGNAVTVDFDDLTIAANTVYTQAAVLPNYGATYQGASGISFPDATHQLRMEEQMSEVPLTFSALIKADEGESGRLVSNHYYAGDASEAKTKLIFAVDTDGSPFLSYTTGTNTTTKYKATSINVQGKGWMHLTAAFDHTHDIIYWYVNGILCERTLNATSVPNVPYQALRSAATIMPQSPIGIPISPFITHPILKARSAM